MHMVSASGRAIFISLFYLGACEKENQYCWRLLALLPLHIEKYAKFIMLTTHNSILHLCFLIRSMSCISTWTTPVSVSRWLALPRQRQSPESTTLLLAGR